MTKVQINNIILEGLLDTGEDISILTRESWPKKMAFTSCKCPIVRDVDPIPSKTKY